MYRGVRYTISCKQLREFFQDPTIGDTEADSWTKANLWWQLKEAELDLAHYRPPVCTAQEALQRFLDLKRAQVGVTISAIRYGGLIKSLGHLLAHLGGEAPLEITPDSFQALYLRFAQRVASGDWSPVTAGDYLRDIRYFLKWAHEHELCAHLPRNLNSRDLRFRVGLPPIRVWTPEEFQWALFHCSPLLRAGLLLMANCGMTPVDVAALTWAEVDLGGGRITRKRTKTAHHPSVPCVSYLLWPTTSRMIRGGGSTSYVLTTQEGKPLYISQVKAGRHSHTNHLASYWWNIRRRINVDKPLNQIRKAGASLLGSHPIYRQVAPLYLGHAPSTMADRHYVQAPQALLDEAILWLGRQLGQVE
jgi:integrase